MFPEKCRHSYHVTCMRAKDLIEGEVVFLHFGMTTLNSLAEVNNVKRFLYDENVWSSAT